MFEREKIESFGDGVFEVAGDGDAVDRDHGMGCGVKGNVGEWGAVLRCNGSISAFTGIASLGSTALTSFGVFQTVYHGSKPEAWPPSS